ncbi:MFS transporter [Sphingopyxis bauzanensis]|uniref:MFS transporter n=1 Tax=Sphingopyxis bauzanensis TaxID=651663 RepID=A0A246K0L4_9SPHN|nr:MULTISPECIES: MFS transporter [Sphingopyxis]MBA4306413.1 MFS transporter [Sphingopyxis sp.]OWQ98988.1 MFS transporter [Sphingopyxis bauzanensis]
MTGTPMTYPPREQAWWMVAVFCFAGFISYTHRLILSVLVDPLQIDLGIGDASISLLQGAAFAIIYVLAGLPLGRLADRGRRRRILIGGALIWCTGSILCGLAPGFWTLFAARAVVGIGEAALAPAAASMIGDAFPPHQRGTAIGVFFMGMVVGGPAAVGIGGVLLGAAQDGAFLAVPLLGTLAPWRIVLILIGVSGLLVPILLLTVREPQRLEAIEQAPLSHVIARLASDRLVLGTLLIAIALLSVGDYGLLSWVPSVLSRLFLWKPEQIGSIFGLVTAIAGIFGALLGGVLSDLFARRGGVRGRLGFSMAAASLAGVGALLVAAPHPALVLLGLGLWTLCSAIAATAGVAALQDVIPGDLRGIGMSLVAFCNTLLGLGMGPTAVALVTERGFGNPLAVGYSVACIVVPAAMLSIGLFHMSRSALLHKRGGRDG